MSLARGNTAKKNTGRKGTMNANSNGWQNQIYQIRLMLAQRELITKMDGRDQARIDTIEAKGTVKVFTVSLQTNFHFDQTRHCNTDFNGKRFISDIKELGGDRSYKQVRECR